MSESGPTQRSGGKVQKDPEMLIIFSKKEVVAAKRVL
jgi:hypothetical protein